MAFSSTSAASQLGSPVSEKLTRENFLLWKAQVMPAIRGAQLTGILNGTSRAPATKLEIEKPDKTKEIIDNPEYEKWLAKDQQLLSYLLNSMSREVLAQVVMLESSAEVWTAIEGMYSARSSARVTNLRMQLSSCKKGEMSAAAYFAKMKAYGDELAVAGRPVQEDEMVSFILAGLDYDYNSLVSSVMGRIDPITLSDLYAQMLAYDMRLQMLQETYGQHQSSANSATRGRGGYRGRGGNRGRGRSGGRGNGGYSNNNNRNNPSTSSKQSSNNKKQLCQICKKPNHEALECWYRYDEDYQPANEKVAGSASTGYGVDTNWYVDSGASDHITSNLENLTVRDKYSGQDRVQAANGSGMRISNIGHTTLYTPSKDLHLKNILHVPSTNKNLVSVHRLTSDNDTFLEFHPNFFLIKDQGTKRVLHRGRCQGGLYSLGASSTQSSPSKQVYGVNKMA